ncbi:hypothetical protein CLOSTMETH_03844 [[Clostridium] methylpentosum DSM 5476]|uniref:Uncharacterized protein n=1 Tax=[Clostridium] methylpentosum DSM 5476 TaxID=537013 RepID=C0EIZ7_9FIRM|nr:hypothetical protein CLOSTMETH_03844 [[Clostridium] methylpentosum DSM 5476]
MRLSSSIPPFLSFIIKTAARFVKHFCASLLCTKQKTFLFSQRFLYLFPLFTIYFLFSVFYNKSVATTTTP